MYLVLNRQLCSVEPQHRHLVSQPIEIYGEFYPTRAPAVVHFVGVPTDAACIYFYHCANELK